MTSVRVVSTVHHPDDTRIRERLIRTLAGSFDVEYVCRAPGPTDPRGLKLTLLEGGRGRRWFAAWRAILRRSDITVVHDPELLPHVMIASTLRRTRGVFDLHERLPDQILTKSWVPHRLRTPMARLARRLLLLAERSVSITLAESGYADLFEQDHPVFPNHLPDGPWPGVSHVGDGSVVYVGDVTPIRGLEDAARAAAQAGMPLTIIGPCAPEFAARLEAVAEEHGGILHMTGRLPFEEAMRMAAGSSVGISPLRDVPNYRHSLPTKILEYRAVGLPVVATDLPGTRDVLSDGGQVWLVPPGDVEAMAEALSAAAQPESRRGAAGDAMSIRTAKVWPSADVVAYYRALLD